MKKALTTLLITLLTIPMMASAEIVCHQSTINFEQLEDIPGSIDLSKIVESRSNVDLVLLGYFGNLCGVDDIEENLCFTGYDKYAAHDIFNYLRKIYYHKRSIHLNYVNIAEEEKNHIILNLSINGETETKLFKRCQVN